MTNSSLRKRLGVAKQNAAQVSDLFSEAKRLGLIKLADEDSPRGGYHPAWA